MNSLHTLMYSSGLASAHYSLAIAAHLSAVNAKNSFLIVTDLPRFGRLSLPPNVDYVHIPGMVDPVSQQKLNGRQPDSSLSSWRSSVRQKVIQAVAETFEPDLIIIERFPIRQKNEMYKTLTYLRQRYESAKIILGPCYISENSNRYQANAQQAQIYEAFQPLYDERWAFRQGLEAVTTDLIDGDLSGYSHKALSSKLGQTDAPEAVSPAALDTIARWTVGIRRQSTVSVP